MSDRIDELLTRPLGYQNARAYAVKHELATIAREAEAMVEWLAERLEESDDTVLMADTWLAAAREAVKQDER